MPIVIPAAPGSSSALQTVPKQNVFDYLYDSQGNPMRGVQIVVTLNVEAANSITPQVSLNNIVVVATTDNNGFWSVNLIPNANISPANTTYSVQVPGIPPYQIAIPSAGGPFQSTSASVLVNTPGLLQPATTGITGNLTVAGNESVTGTLGVTGATTLGQLTAGATTLASLGATTMTGDLTIASAFRLLFGAAVAKIVGGATSLSIRDNADANDNLLVANGGDVTVRSRLLLASAVSKLVPGATSMSLRNNADNADNVLVTDAGLVTLRNALNVPPTAGGALAAGMFGTVPVLFAVQTPSSGTNVTQSVPASFRHVLVVYSVAFSASASLLMQLNGDTGATHYFWAHNDAANDGTRAGSGSGGTGAASAEVGFVGTGGNLDAAGSVLIKDVQQTARHIRWSFECAYDNNAAPVFHSLTGHGLWQPTALAALTSIAINMGTITSSSFEFWGYP